MSTSATRRSRHRRRAQPEPTLFERLFAGRGAELADSVGRISIIDFVVGALLVFRVAAPGIGLPTADTAMLVLTAISVLRRPKRATPHMAVLAVTGMLLLTFLVIETHAQGGSFLQRGVRIGALMLFALFLADGRIDLRSLLLGLGLSMLANIPLFYLGVAPDAYGGVLSGFFTDKNLAGLNYAIFPLVFAAFVRSAGVRWAIILLGGGAVYLTGSRTALFALAAGVVWMLVTRRLELLPRIGVAAAIHFAYQYLEDNFAHAGQFAERVGSDLLRERIDAASLAKIEAAPWYGYGLGTAVVEVEDRQWFFHNSFWALIAEGGVVLCVVMVGLVVWTIFLARQPGGERTVPRASIEGAGVVVLLCATRLGEVFFSVPMFIVLGAALLLLGEAAEQHGGTAEAAPTAQRRPDGRGAARHPAPPHQRRHHSGS